MDVWLGGLERDVGGEVVIVATADCLALHI